MFKYAIQKLLIEQNPALPLQGVIELPETEHHRKLNEDELGAFWRALGRQHNADPTALAAARMLMYSMVRKNEVLRAKWAEFNFDKAQWDIPRERMKMRRPHRVFHAGAFERIFLYRTHFAPIEVPTWR